MELGGAKARAVPPLCERLLATALHFNDIMIVFFRLATNGEIAAIVKSKMSFLV